MNDDILSLVMEYKQELDDTFEIIRLVNARYNFILDVSFSTYSEIIDFVELMKAEISNSMFIMFENRCPECHDMDIGHYTYINDLPLTIGVLFEFVRHMKMQGRVCVHEKIDTLSLCSIISVLRFKWS